MVKKVRKVNVYTEMKDAIDARRKMDRAKLQQLNREWAMDLANAAHEHLPLDDEF